VTFTKWKPPNQIKILQLKFYTNKNILKICTKLNIIKNFFIILPINTNPYNSRHYNIHKKYSKSKKIISKIYFAKLTNLKRNNTINSPNTRKISSLKLLLLIKKIFHYKHTILVHNVLHILKVIAFKQYNNWIKLNKPSNVHVKLLYKNLFQIP
jgi:hypothetical protein